MEIVDDPVITNEQIFELEMHSFINILNVISAQLQLIRMICKHPSLLNRPVAMTQELAYAIRANNRKDASPSSLEHLSRVIQQCLHELEEKEPEILQDREYSGYVDTFKQIFQVLDIRIDELYRRWDQPREWEAFSIDVFRKELIHFLGAIEKNSRGRYRIVYNIAEQEKNDYLVHVNITSDDPEELMMPLLIKDSIRDLIANARKYTPPGGKIDVGLSSREGVLRFVIEDNGYGIPADEITRVVTYGYRASNVIDEVRTMGNGLGLTKAYYVTKQFGGRFWLDSREKKGTVVRFEIPIPD